MLLLVLIIISFNEALMIKSSCSIFKYLSLKLGFCGFRVIFLSSVYLARQLRGNCCCSHCLWMRCFKMMDLSLSLHKRLVFYFFLTFLFKVLAFHHTSGGMHALESLMDNLNLKDLKKEESVLGRERVWQTVFENHW
ncbi:hypothetical protein Sjap_015021 [Stephania japonica]|uniref:Uncharacterized protein n=1 Tax=Stephania japonica TaxID=461633 RepID=A0AAP0IIC8_9MAGN